METPAYYAVIPADVRYDNNLTGDEKLLYAEITVLTNKTGSCWATNQYFATLFSCSTNTISRRINRLVSQRYIESRLIYRNGTKEIERRELRLLPLPPIPTNGDTPYPQIWGYPIPTNGEDNNTSINITSKYISLVTEIYEYFPEDMRPKDKRSAARWSDCMRRLIELDGYTYEQVKRVVQMARADKFWSRNFLTFVKLRNKNKDGVMYMRYFVEQFKKTWNESDF